MSARNTHGMTALQEFQRFQPEMIACHEVTQLKQSFVSVLSWLLFHSEYLLESTVTDHSYVLVFHYVLRFCALSVLRSDGPSGRVFFCRKKLPNGMVGERMAVKVRLRVRPVCTSH